MTHEQIEALQAAAQPLMDYLTANHHPHMSVIVTSERAELVEGVAGVMRKNTHRKEDSEDAPLPAGFVRQQCKECDCTVLQSLAPDCPGIAECVQCSHPNDIA